MTELTDQQLELMSARLTKLETELRELLTTTKEESEPVQLEAPIGRLTRMDAIQQQKMAQVHRRRNQVRLQQVVAAREAIPRNTYGLCRRCEEDIGWERLCAKPETPVCLSCQKELESEE